MKTLTLLLLLLFALAFPAPTSAANVTYDYPAAGVTVTQVAGWTPVLYVNGTAFNLPAPTCTASGVLVACFAVMPDVSAALTASGTQTFQLALRDVVLGEGTKSIPLALIRPLAPTSLRIAWALSALPDFT